MMIKKISYGALSLALLAPAAVFAQFQDPQGTGLPSGSVTSIIQNIMFWLLMMVGIIGVIGFVIAGILYLTAAGDEGQIERAKKAMIYSIVGVLVALIGLVVIGAVRNLLSGSSTKF